MEVTPVQQEQSSPKTADLDPSAPSEAHSISVAEASPSKMETPFNQEESDPCTTDPEASTPSKTSGLPTVVHSAVLEGSIVSRETESSNLLQKNKPQNEVFMYSRYICIKITFSFPLPKYVDSCVCRTNARKKKYSFSQF